MIKQFKKASELPPSWDELTGDNYAMKRDFLAMMELGNPCGQEYYLFTDSDGNADSILMTCQVPRSNILMYTKFSFYFSVTYVHVPLSITQRGYIIGEKTRAEVDAFICSLQGSVILVNWPEGEPPMKGFYQMPISPQISMKIRWKSFDAYLTSFRSHYRYRYKKALKKASPLRFDILTDNGDFGEEHYKLYMATHNKSRIGVETLQIAYFQQCPAKIMVASLDEKPVGFVQLIEHGKELVFAFVGLDYKTNQQYDTYFALLLKMVAYAIDKGFDTLELGQTAEEAKLKLGGEYTPLFAQMRHSNFFMHLGLGLMAPFIGWREFPNIYHIFKESNHA